MDNMIVSYKPNAGVSGVNVVNSIFQRCSSPHGFSVYTDLASTADDLSFETVNPIEALLGEGGVTETFKGELARDWYDVYLVNRVGSDSDVQVRQGKNLLGVSYDVDETNVATRILPTGEDENGEVLYLGELYLDSPYLGAYPHPKWMHIHVSEAKVSDDMSVYQAMDKLRAAASKELENGCDTGVKRIITNDVYIGTLRCCVSKLPRMKGKRRRAPKDEHIVHENFMDAIISSEDFEAVQTILMQRTKNKQRDGQNQRVHRYAGILKCAECGNGFTTRSRRDKEGNLVRLVYNCTTHYRFGNEYCSGHTIHESTIDEHVFSTLEQILRSGSLQLGEIERRIDEDAIKPDFIEKQRESLQRRIASKKEEVKDYARQFARRLIDEEMFQELSQETRAEVAQMELQLSLCTVEEKNPEEEKQNFRDNLKMLETILETRNLTPLDIATLIDHIEVHETDVLGPYRVPEMELTIYWNILEFGELLEGVGEVV